MKPRRATAILGVIALVLAACSGAGESAPSATSTSTPGSTVTTTSTPAPTPTPTTSPTSTSTDPGSTTTSTEPPESAFPELLVATDDGVFLVGADGAATLLIEGRAAIAIDDLEGGVLFQQERDTRQRASTVYRVRPDGDRAVATLVADLDQSLSLSGVARDGGEAYVYYTRDEGDNPDDARQTLRRYGLDSRVVTELATIGGWESGAQPVSVGAGLLLFNWSSEGTSGIDVTDLLGNTVSVIGNPSPPEGFFDCNACPSVAAISSDATALVYRQVIDFTDFAVIVDVATGEELDRIELNGINRWRVTSFDLGTGHLVVNRAFNDDRLPALVYDLRRSFLPPVELEMAGEAYVTRSPVTVVGPVPAP